MTIAPLDREFVRSLRDEPLPVCWLRRGPTELDSPELVGDGLLRVGADELLHRSLVNLIDEADEVVLVASFLLADEQLAEAMLRAVARKVRVYALTASENRVSAAVREDDLFAVNMAKEHKQLLDRLAGRVLVRTAEHLHAKFLIADPNGRMPRGYLSTANFNLALRKSVELCVRLQPLEAQALADWFSWTFWANTDRELTDKKGRLSKVSEPPAVPTVPDHDSIAVTSKDHFALRRSVLRLIGATRRELFISTYGMELSHAVTQAVLGRLASGVNVTVMTRPRPAILPAMRALVEAGAVVVAHDKLHAKAIVSDAGALVMTANLQAHGLDHGFEVGVHLNDSRAQALRQILSEWRDSFPWQLALDARRGDHEGEIWLAEYSLRDGRRQVVAEQPVTLKAVTARDALSLEKTSNPEMRIPEFKDYPQQVRFQWQIRPPKLPKKSKPLLRQDKPVKSEKQAKDSKKQKKAAAVPYDPPAFQRGEDRFVVLRSERDIASARKLAAELGARVVLE